MLRSRNSHFLRQGLAAQARNIRALILRDMMMRYGRDNIGFVWVILEPLLLTAGVMVIWSFTMGSGKHGVRLVEFVLTGYLPLTLWRHMSNNSIGLFRRSAGLLYHRYISLFDILISRMMLELIGTTAAFLVVWGSLCVAGLAAPIENLGLLILGWLMMAWLAGVVGTIIAAVTEVSETAERFIQPIQYVTLPMSGAFFMVDWLPTWAQHAVLFNPMVHCYEVFRAGYFGPFLPTHYDLTYFCAWAFGLTFIGVISIQRVRSHVRLN
jgi:capsular polysaccharide transport system permease protein